MFIALLNGSLLETGKMHSLIVQKDSLSSEAFMVLYSFCSTYEKSREGGGGGLLFDDPTSTLFEMC